MSEVPRPLLRYHGGKWSIAPWVISHFISHGVYVESFGGGGSVLLQKTPARVEVYNDLDSNVVNLFRCLRSPILSKELIRQLELTPFSEEEYRLAEDTVRGLIKEDCPLERARRTFAYACMSYGGYMPGRTCQMRRPTIGKPIVETQLTSRIGVLHKVIERLRNVLIDNKPALEVIVIYDSPGTLHYIDPPYVHESRTSQHGYLHEMDESAHLALLEAVQQLQGYVFISGYENQLYTDSLQGWHCVTRNAERTIGVRHENKETKVEHLWISPNVKLPDNPQLSIFEIGREETSCTS